MRAIASGWIDGGELGAPRCPPARPIADVTEIAILTAYQHNTICVSKQRRSPSLFPVNRASGTGVGFRGQLHLYLDDMFPPRSAGCCLAAVRLFRRTSASEAPPRATKIAAAGITTVIRH